MRYAIYLPTTGQILRVAVCSVEDSLIQTTGDEALLTMPVGDDSTHYVEESALVAMPAKPTDNHVFDWATKLWIDPRTLEDFKAEKWAKIKQAREEAFNAPLVTPYGTFDSNARARTSITDAVLMVQTLEAREQYSSINFTLADNSVVLLTSVEMVNVGLLLGEKIQQAHSQARTLRIAIEAATTVVELESIVWVS